MYTCKMFTGLLQSLLLESYQLKGIIIHCWIELSAMLVDICVQAE